MKSYKTSKKISRMIIYIVLIFASIICIFPFIWMVSTSFKPISEIYAMPPKIIPDNFILDNYILGWQQSDFAIYFRNTFIVAISATIGTVITSAFVAYGFSRFKSRWSDLLFLILLATMMLPSQVTLIPQYFLFSKVNMIDTFWPLIIPSWLGGGAFNVFLFTQFFRSLPKELDEAAEIDGANTFQIFIKILLPSVKAVIMAVAVMALVFNWNDFFNPLIYLNSNEKFTVAIGLQFFKGSQGNVQVGQMMAMAVVSLIPVLIIFSICQKYFIQGIKMSGLKG